MYIHSVKCTLHTVQNVQYNGNHILLTLRYKCVLLTTMLLNLKLFPSSKLPEIELFKSYMEATNAG